MAAPDPATQDRIYHAIRDDLAIGAIKPGARLEAPSLSGRYGASVTPVREALYRLVGEGLVRLHHGGGFGVPALTTVSVRDLYDLNLHILLASLHRSGGGIVAERQAAPALNGRTYADQTAQLFTMMAGKAANGEWQLMIGSLNQRLAPLRHAEYAVLATASVELEQLHELAAGQGGTTLRGELRRYHARRVRAAAKLHAHVMLFTGW